MGGVRGEEKWRQDGTGAPEGRLGEGKGSRAQRGKGRDHWEGRGSKGSMASISRAHLGPWEPAEIPGLILCPLRPPPATQVLREWEGEKAEQK